MLATWTRRALGGGGAILCFHGLATADAPACGDAHVPVDDLAALVDVARRHREIVPLADLIGRHRKGRSTSGLAALTFDDAYATLLPVLTSARRSIPMTIFVVSGAVERGTSYWWDRVDDLYPCVPLERWRRFETSCGLPQEYRRGQPPEYGPLRPLRQWVLATYAGRWPPHLADQLAALEREMGRRTRQRSMTFDELAVVASIPGMTLGVHTQSHPVLPLLPPAELHREIAECHARLRERFQNVLPVLAAPFGLYDERTVLAARAAGMQATMTLGGASVSAATDVSGFPRLCLTRQDTPLKLALRLLGIPDRVRAWFADADRSLYPALPSPTT